MYQSIKQGNASTRARVQATRRTAEKETRELL